MLAKSAMSRRNTVTLTDFAGMNEAFAEFFTPPYGARTTVQSNLLYRVAIDVIVALDE